MRVVGLISGTSVDGIDAVLVEVAGREIDLTVRLLAAETYAYPKALRQQILAVCGGEPLSLMRLAQLDDRIAAEFAKAALAIQQGQTPAELIGSHGQTVFHRPPDDQRQGLGYTVQLGRGEIIAQRAGLPTVSNFRSADIALGGHGAPLVPRIDACLLSHPTRHRCVQNLGGIGNVTYLPSYGENRHWLDQVIGWDTGPGNVLLDLAVQQLSQGQLLYDEDGAWAAQGKPCETLVQQWLEHPFFRLAPPKSTGRELFGVDYLQQCWADARSMNLSDADWLATLTEFTVASIVQSYAQFLPHPVDEVLLCGGGSRNTYLRQRLQSRLGPIPLGTTGEQGVNADAKEAIAFAILAYWHQLGIPGNLPQVTGAARAAVLGQLHQPWS